MPANMSSRGGRMQRSVIIITSCCSLPLAMTQLSRGTSAGGTMGSGTGGAASTRSWVENVDLGLRALALLDGPSQRHDGVPRRSRFAGAGSDARGGPRCRAVPSPARRGPGRTARARPRAFVAYARWAVRVGAGTPRAQALPVTRRSAASSRLTGRFVLPGTGTEHRHRHRRRHRGRRRRWGGKSSHTTSSRWRVSGGVGRHGARPRAYSAAPSTATERISARDRLGWSSAERWSAADAPRLLDSFSLSEPSRCYQARLLWTITKTSAEVPRRTGRSNAPAPAPEIDRDDEEQKCREAFLNFGVALGHEIPVGFVTLAVTGHPRVEYLWANRTDTHP